MNFEIWLQTATQGLPQNRIDTIRAELTGHYLDAVDDYLLQGLSSENAHYLALRELGDAKAVCDGLRSVHIHPRDYWRAMLIACMPTACVMLFLPAISQINRYDAIFLEWIYSIFITITAVMSIWATINSLHMIGMIGYLGEEASVPISLIRMGLYLLFPITIFTAWFTKAVFISIINTPTFTYSMLVDFDNLLVVAISVIASFGLMLTGVGWVIFAINLTSLPSVILPLLRGLMFVLGMGLILLSAGAILLDIRLTAISTTITLIFGILTFALFIILFYQMGRNSTPSRPSFA